MRKLTLIAICMMAALAAKAQGEVITYNFFDSFGWCAVLEEEWGSNYDFIDKTGTTINQEGVILCEKDDDNNWHAIAEYLDQGISLEDGLLKPRSEMEASGEAFIGWGEAGPARTLWMTGWGTKDFESFVPETNYDALTEDDWVPCHNGLAFNRNSNSASREDTYLQLPAVQGPCTLTVWAGATKSDYSANLRSVVTPVVDGVVGETVTLIDTEDYTLKRYQRLPSISYDGDGSVAWRIGCDKMEVYYMYIKIELGSETGIHDAVVAGGKDGESYNLQGMKVGSGYKGIVIRDGRKYVQD